MSHKFNVKMEAELTRDELSGLFEKFGEREGSQWEVVPIGEHGGFSEGFSQSEKSSPVPSPMEVKKVVEE